MTKKIMKWRLGTLPSPDEVRELVKDSIITKEEAREILFNSEDEIERDKKSLESEVKFLRELVEKLSNNNRTEIIKTIEIVEKPYVKYPWFKQYDWYCASPNNTVYCSADNQSQNVSFAAIKTF